MEKPSIESRVKSRFYDLIRPMTNVWGGGGESQGANAWEQIPRGKRLEKGAGDKYLGGKHQGWGWGGGGAIV